MVRSADFVEGEERFRSGQDGVVPGHNIDAPPARAARRKHPRRTTERVELTLQPADAAAIRIAAELLGMTISGYVTQLVAVAGDPTKLARERDDYADGANLAASLSYLVEEIRRSRAEFGRAGGLVKSFFVRDADSRDTAEDYAHDLSAALREFTDAGKRVEESLDELKQRLNPVFADIEKAARRLATG